MRFATIVGVLLASLLFGGGAAAEQNSAGLVVRHGDGTLVYVWVPFEEESITSEQLLTRSGLEAVVTPFGGLGTAVCSLDGEGCPSSDCFCKSYTSPAYFWHFYALRDGQWIEELAGPTSRTIRNGDIDGWAWTAGEHGLPLVTIDEIAALNGVREAVASPTVDRPSTPVATPASAPEPTTRVVVVAPDGTPVAREPAAPDAGDGAQWPLFAGMAGVAIVVGALAALRRRKAWPS